MHIQEQPLQGLTLGPDPTDPAEGERGVTLELAIEAVRRVLPARRRSSTHLAADVRFEEDLAFTSLDVAEVFTRLEELVGRPLETTDDTQAKTIGDLLRIRPAPERAW